MQNPCLLARQNLAAGYPGGLLDHVSVARWWPKPWAALAYDWAVLDMEHTPLDMMEVDPSAAGRGWHAHGADHPRAVERHR